MEDHQWVSQCRHTLSLLDLELVWGEGEEPVAVQESNVSNKRMVHINLP